MLETSAAPRGLFGCAVTPFSAPQRKRLRVAFTNALLSSHRRRCPEIVLGLFAKGHVLHPDQAIPYECMRMLRRMAVQRPELQAFLSRVTAQGEEAPRTDDDALGGAYNTIEVHTTDGRVLTETLEEPRGGPAAPLDWDELLAKYRDCATRVLDADSTAQTAEMIVSMDELADVRALTAALSTAATSVASGTPA